MKVLLLALALAAPSGHVADLKVTPVVVDGQSAQVRTVNCTKAECPLVAKLKVKDFSLDKRKGCAQRYYGKEQVKVKGTFKGKKINVMLSRQNACENVRYNKVLSALAGDLVG